MKEELRKKSLQFALLYTLGMGGLAVLGIVTSNDIIYGTVFPIIILVGILPVWGSALRSGGVEAFCKKTAHPDLTKMPSLGEKTYFRSRIAHIRCAPVKACLSMIRWK